MRDLASPTAARRSVARARLGVLVLLATAAFVWCAPASADLTDETALAKSYAPVLRLVEQPEECGPGEPYEPMDVDLLFGEPTVALRGPWNRVDLVKIAPTAGDLAGLYDYHLDFPGDALNPGCDYERWARRVTGSHAPAVYAHVATDPGFPGKLALQYWIFYAYNDWNNLHEGDWENVQLDFDVATAAEALSHTPVSIGYSQHEGAERANWGDAKLELVDGRHPVVYPAAGSHANFFDSSLYIGSSASQGVGCDDTRGPHVELHPTVFTIPSDPAAARRAFPWIAFQGRWGELQEAFFNGPTGPNLKGSWTAPIHSSESWRDRSFAVPAGGAFGTSATDFFCTAVGAGSVGLIRLLRNPALMLGGIAVVLAALLFGASRTTWRPTAPLRLAHRRSWGQILAAAGRMYFHRLRLFIGIGLLLIPVLAVVDVLQRLLFAGARVVGVEVEAGSGGTLVLIAVGLGTTLTVLGLALVQAATARALVEIDEGRPIGPIRAYRLALAKLRPLLGATALAVAMWVALSTTVILLPVAIWLVIRLALLAQVAELEGRAAVDSLRQSSRLVRRRWIRVATLVGASAGMVLLAGPLVGASLILLTGAPLEVLNLVAALVYALAMPLVALTTAYVYFDARTRLELDPADEPDELPAEIRLGAS